jgi:hypothetical protein
LKERVRDERDKNTINKGVAPQTYHGKPSEIKNEIKGMKQWKWGAKIEKSRNQEINNGVRRPECILRKLAAPLLIYPGCRLGWRRWLRKIVGGVQTMSQESLRKKGLTSGLKA